MPVHQKFVTGRDILIGLIKQGQIRLRINCGSHHFAHSGIANWQMIATIILKKKTLTPFKLLGERVLVAFKFALHSFCFVEQSLRAQETNFCCRNKVTL